MENTRLNDHTFVSAHEYSNHQIKPVQIPISCEYIIAILVNGIPFSTIASSPSELKSLAAGHLFAEGIIGSAEEIKDIKINYKKLEINVITGSGDKARIKDKKKGNLKVLSAGSIRNKKYTPLVKKFKISKLPDINPELILSGMKEFLRMSDLHRLTHGVHSSALYKTDGEMIAFFDDIGRHNAIDKVIGYALQKKISLYDKMLFSTGRLASEIVLKIINASIPVIISRASPTSMSFELAKNYNLIMIGKTREDRFSIFNGKKKISMGMDI